MKSLMTKEIGRSAIPKVCQVMANPINSSQIQIMLFIGESWILATGFSVALPIGSSKYT